VIAKMPANMGPNFTRGGKIRMRKVLKSIQGIEDQRRIRRRNSLAGALNKVQV
jgi:hypothetical protein